MTPAELAARGVECTCDEGHTIARLGHADGCPYYQGGRDAPPFPAVHDSCTLSNTTAHDFDWATYHGEAIGTGVCACGLRAIDWHMVRGEP